MEQPEQEDALADAEAAVTDAAEVVDAAAVKGTAYHCRCCTLKHDAPECQGEFSDKQNHGVKVLEK